MTTVIRGGLIVTMNAKREIIAGDIRLDGDRIVAIGKNLPRLPGKQETEIEAANCFVMPGLIQVHIHLCQTLFRGLADDLELLDWLQEKIWPLEKAHNPESLRASARLGLLELQSGGTTTIVDMGTTTGADTIFAEAEACGMRFYGGNCFMDLKSSSGPLYRSLPESLAEMGEVIAKWHRRTPLLECVIAPRFAISCSEKMMRAGLELQQRHGLLLHTHASENRSEVALIKKRTGKCNVDYLDSLGLLNNRSVIAHGVHLTKGEVKKMVNRQAGLAHCPTSNMKLASGLAPIPEYRRAGMKVGLGADGAPCNNTLDGFVEMRLASLIHKPKFGPTVMPADEVLRMATLGGAEILGRSADIGSLEVGKLADVVIVDRSNISVGTVENAYSALVYSCSGRDVRDVWVHGRSIIRNRQHFLWTPTATLDLARQQLAALKDRLVKPLRP